MVLCTFQKNYYRWFSQHQTELLCVVGLFVMIPSMYYYQNNPELADGGIIHRSAPFGTAICVAGSLVLLLKLLSFLFKPRHKVLRWQNDALYLNHSFIQFGVVNTTAMSVQPAQNKADRMLTLKLNAAMDPYSYRLHWHNQAGVLKTSDKGYVADIPVTELELLLDDKVVCVVTQEEPFFRGSGSRSST
jgi:hypothetical protein